MDDESWRLIPESWPYSREKIWARVIRNLAKAGAKVIAFDIEFDKPDHKSEEAVGILRNYKDVTGFDVDAAISENDKVLKHGDNELAEAVHFAKSKGSEVIFATALHQRNDDDPEESADKSVTFVNAGTKFHLANRCSINSRQIMFELKQEPKHTEEEVANLLSKAIYPTNVGTKLLLENR